jgi:hypothetical protein
VGLLRPWTEAQVTWNRAATGQNWASPGASGIGTDRLAETTASTLVTGGAAWWTWDVTALAKEWVSGNLPNNGLMLISGEAGIHREIEIVAREHGQPAELVIEFARQPRYENYTLTLYPGMNMVSLPVEPDNNALDSLLASISGKLLHVWAYDPANPAQPWQVYDPRLTDNTLVTFDFRAGYWVEMSAAASLTVNGMAYYGYTVPLKAGWNLIGYPGWRERDLPAALEGIAPHVQVIWHYDGSDINDPWKRYNPSAPAYANDLARLAPGQGYWIMVSQDCELLVR